MNGATALADKVFWKTLRDTFLEYQILWDKDDNLYIEGIDKTGHPLSAIFRSSGTSGSGGTNTTNGNQLTWTWPTGAGNTVTPSPAATPVVTQTLYRRSTHDENGDAKQFTKEQEQMWRDLASIATMTSSYIWKTAEEIFRDAEDYQKRMRTTGVYIALSTVETSLAVLVVNGMVEMKNA